METRGGGNRDTLEAILGQLQELNRLVGEIAVRMAPEGADRGIDPGDAVPPGVAPETPAPLTADDKKARRNLERLARRRARSDEA